MQYVRKIYFCYWSILGIDTAISVSCSLVAYAVIHYMAHVPMTDWMLCKFACVSLVASVAGSLLFHTYRNTIRFSQARELWRIMCACLLYTSDAADEEDSVDLGGRRIIKKKIFSSIRRQTR